MERLHDLVRDGLAALFARAALIERAWAQAPAPSTPPAPVREAGALEAAVALGIVLGLLVVVGIAVKLYDMKRRRGDEAAALQARLSDALLLDPSLAGLPIVATVRMSLRRSVPPVVTLSGVAPSPERHEAAIRLMIREVTKARDSYRIEDRLAVNTLMSKRAA